MAIIRERIPGTNRGWREVEVPDEPLTFTLHRERDPGTNRSFHEFYMPNKPWVYCCTQFKEIDGLERHGDGYGIGDAGACYVTAMKFCPFCGAPLPDSFPPEARGWVDTEEEDRRLQAVTQARLKGWPIWMEGYAATGDSSPATFQGWWVADTFDQACQRWANDDPSRAKDFSPTSLSYWGCRLFDNEDDARRSFG